MCFSDIVYGIIYMYITKYGCVFLKTLAKVYTWQCIPILLGSLPLAHNAQHSLVINPRAHAQGELLYIVIDNIDT